METPQLRCTELACAACCRGPRRLLIPESEAHRRQLRTDPYSVTPPEYRPLHPGARRVLHVGLARHPDGTCVYLDTTRNSCTIYGNRPDACRRFDCRQDGPYPDHIEAAAAAHRLLDKEDSQCWI